MGESMLQVATSAKPRCDGTSRPRNWLATGVPARARARASDLSRQFRWCFPVSWAAPEALNRHPAHGPRRACPSRMQFSSPSARYRRLSIFANALCLSKLYAILIWGYAPRFTEQQTPHVPLFAAGLVLGATVAILVAVCRWPSQRLAKGAGRSNWSSTRATM